MAPATSTKAHVPLARRRPACDAWNVLIRYTRTARISAGIKMEMISYARSAIRLPHSLPPTRIGSNRQHLWRCGRWSVVMLHMGFAAPLTLGSRVYAAVGCAPAPSATVPWHCSAMDIEVMMCSAGVQSCRADCEHWHFRWGWKL